MISCDVTPPTEQLGSIPEFAELGPLFKSSDRPVDLTESETEYVVRCVKHIFNRHMVLQVRSRDCHVISYPIM